MNDDRFVECLDYVHKDFFSDLEAAMDDFIEALGAYKERCE